MPSTKARRNSRKNSWSVKIPLSSVETVRMDYRGGVWAAERDLPLAQP